MPEYLAPGVYIEEIDTGPQPIEGVSTSTAAMVGVTERGPVNVPILLTSYGDFTRWFGGRLNKNDFSNGNDPHCYLPHAVEGFFTNGGKRLYLTRVIDASAPYAQTDLFDRGSDTSAQTLLLRAAGELTGTPATPPLLYVLSDPGLKINSWIRIGDGSTAEYKQLAANEDTTNAAYIVLDFPLSRSHAASASVEQFQWASTAAFTLQGAVKSGTQAIVIVGAPADINALPMTTDLFLEVGPNKQGEYRFATVKSTDIKVIDATHSQATVTLDSDLMLSHADQTTVTALTKHWTANPASQLDSVGAASGDRIIFLSSTPAASSDLVIIDRDPDAATNQLREIRRVGTLSELTLTTGSYETYQGGSIVEGINLSDDTRLIYDPTPAPLPQAGDTTIPVDDVTALVIGQRVLIGGGNGGSIAEPGPLVIQAIAPIGGQVPKGIVTLATPLTNAHNANDTVKLVAKTLTTNASAGTSVLALSDRLGLAAGDVLRIDSGVAVEVITIRAIAQPLSGVPNSGNVLLTQPLNVPHVAGTHVWRERVSQTGITRQPTTLVVDTAAGATTLLVTDGNNYNPPGSIRVTTPSGDVLYHQLEANATTTLKIARLTLVDPLERAHAQGLAVVGRTPLLEVQALDQGSWGNRLRISVVDEPTGLVSKTTVIHAINQTHIHLASTVGVEPGTVLELFDPVANTVIPPLLKVESIDRTTNYTVVLQADSALSLAQLGQAQSAITAGTPLAVRSREFLLTVQLLRQPDPAFPSRDEIIIDTEVFRNLSMDDRHSHYVVTVIGDISGPPRLSDQRPDGASWYIRVSDVTPSEDVRLGPETLVDTLASGRIRPARQALEKGDDALLMLDAEDTIYIGDDNDEPLKRTGLQTFRNVSEISLVASPSRTSPAMQQALIDHCELMLYRFAVLDGPPPPHDELTDVQTQRQQFDTKYAALYHPWLLIPDPFPANLTATNDFPIPPAGHVLGVYARTDDDRGVYKAPANEVVLGILGLQRLLNKAEQEILNPHPSNINVIRDFRSTDRSFRIWGARVITSDSDWKYVNVRRLLIFIEASLDSGLQWVVFEPNAEPLWARVRGAITSFLTDQWRSGALEGTTAAEAFFVKCDRSTMTQSDIDNGRLICVVGVAPVKPAEFVIVRVGLFTAQATS